MECEENMKIIIDFGRKRHCEIRPLGIMHKPELYHGGLDGS